MDKRTGRKIKAPERGLYARVSRVDRIGDGRWARVSYEFDGIDRTDVEGGEMLEALNSPRITAPFAIVRIVTTPSRMLYVVGREPAVGDWFLLNIGPREKPGGPLLFHCQLGPTGYSEVSEGSLRASRFLFNDAEPEPRPLGSAALITSDRILARECSFPEPAITRTCKVANVFRSLPPPKLLRVLDVGQASFVALEGSDGQAIAYFDAGWPLKFNRRTEPQTPPPISSGAPVILSHWDFDHLLGFYQFPELREASWIAPVQKLGPGAQKVARILASSGHLMGLTGTCMTGSYHLAVCGGVGMNDSGTALSVKLLSGKSVLLVGDASYNTVPFAMGLRWHGLVITHHGGDFSGNVPTPSQIGATGIASVGAGNVYKHPKARALKKHVDAGWTIQTTAGKGRHKRGNRILA